MTGSAWQRVEVAREFLRERRRGLPYAADQREMLLRLVRHLGPEPRLVLDLGCGDGIMARTLLRVWPGAQALLLDSSEPMLAQAGEAMAEFGDRCRIVPADLKKPLADHVLAESIDVAVSGYAIHHLPDARKRSLYGEVFSALVPGGLFVNVEHVASPTRRLERFWDEFWIDSVARRAGKPLEQAAAEYHGRPDKADNILAPVETQVEWLREIGFQDCDCYFKYLELAVFGGIKTAAEQ